MGDRTPFAGQNHETRHQRKQKHGYDSYALFNEGSVFDWAEIYGARFANRAPEPVKELGGTSALLSRDEQTGHSIYAY